VTFSLTLDWGRNVGASYDTANKQCFPPNDPKIQDGLKIVMKGTEPLLLFKTLARDPRLFWKFMNGALLDPGNLSLRFREIVIYRTTANCHSDYEVGGDAALFAERAELKPADLRALAQSPLEANALQRSDPERVLVEACDQLHTTSTLDDACWRALEDHKDEAVIERFLLVGFYRRVSFLTNGLRLPNEPFATSHLPGSREPR
jgi:hypothetical protein